MFSTYDSLKNWGENNDFRPNYLHFGRYIMDIEIGSNIEGKLSLQQQKDIKVEYFIVDNDSFIALLPHDGILIDQDALLDADKTGYIWVRVKNPNPEVNGIINIDYLAYNCSIWFSEIVYTKVIQPITEEFHTITKNFYTKLTRNASLQRIGRLALVMYICIYVLTFLVGIAQITAKDLIIRIIKITLIIILLGENSWKFFNTYLFSVFVDGTDYIMANVVGITNSKANILGFIDPVVARYTNDEIWRLLFFELLQYIMVLPW